MELQKIISDQSVSRRTRPQRGEPERSLIHIIENGRIGKKIHKRHSDAPKSGMLSFRENNDTRRSVREYTRKLPAALFEKIQASLGALASRRAVSIMGIAVGCAFLSLGVTALTALEKKADLRGFVLNDDGTIESILLDTISPEKEPADSGISLAALPTRVSVATYKVAKNDTLDSIARRFGLRLDTLISINGIGNARYLREGASLKIPSINGVMHVVQKGENIASIAKTKNVSVIDVLDANDLSSDTITAGQALFIPGARLASYDLKKALGTLVVWPVRGAITDYFGYRPNPFTGVRQFHNGIDIRGSVNTPIKAAMDGRVAETGYSAIFGNFVIMTHAEGYQTLYAHLNKISVKQGARINQGTLVGLLGSTGYSTGPHLHFGVFKNSQAINPLKILK